MNREDIGIAPFSLESATDPQTEAWYNLVLDHNREIHPEDPDVPLERMLSRSIAMYKSQEGLAWAVWMPDGSMSSYCRVHVSKAGYGRDRATFGIIVRRSERRRGIGTFLLKNVVQGAEAYGRSKLRAYSNDRCPAATSFLESMGAERISTGSWSQLEIEKVDRKTIDAWMQYPSGPGPAIHIGRWDDHFPEGSLQEVCDLYQTIHRHQQLENGETPDDVRLTPEIMRAGDEAALCDGSRRILTYAEESGSGRLAGLTEVLWHPSVPEIIKQGYTAVLPDCRGRGIGRRLKAEMLARSMEEIPLARFIRTGNDESRKAILKINHELGFRPYMSQYTWEIETKALKEHLTKTDLNRIHSGSLF